MKTGSVTKCECPPKMPAVMFKLVRKFGHKECPYCGKRFA